MSKSVCWYGNVLEYYFTCAFNSFHSYTQILCQTCIFSNEQNFQPEVVIYIYIYMCTYVMEHKIQLFSVFSVLESHRNFWKLLSQKKFSQFFLFLFLAFLKLCFLFPVLRGNTRPVLTRWLFIPALYPSFPCAAVPSSPCVTAQTTVYLSHG